MLKHEQVELDEVQEQSEPGDGVEWGGMGGSSRDARKEAAP